MKTLTVSVIVVSTAFLGVVKLPIGSVSYAATSSAASEKGAGGCAKVETTFRLNKGAVIRAGESSPVKTGEVQIVQERKRFLGTANGLVVLSEPGVRSTQVVRSTPLTASTRPSAIGGLVHQS
jgi:hypothetical protein